MKQRPQTNWADTFFPYIGQDGGGVVLFTEKERKGSWATLWNTDSHALDKIRIR